MAELTVESGPLSGQTLAFTEDTTFLVGSGEGCSLRLQTPGIADQHLVIKALKDGGFGIKMLGGPFSLNGKDAEAARLREGDISPNEAYLKASDKSRFEHLVKGRK